MNHNALAFSTTFAWYSYHHPSQTRLSAFQQRICISPSVGGSFVSWNNSLYRYGFDKSKRATINCCTEEKEIEENQEKQPPRFKFDANSDKDAFGRDPKKETEFWMDAAKTVLESDEVQKAVNDHREKGGDGLTDEQRAYMEFIKSLDEAKGDE